jgi:hypothetical protein
LEEAHRLVGPESAVERQVHLRQRVADERPALEVFLDVEPVDDVLVGVDPEEPLAAGFPQERIARAGEALFEVGDLRQVDDADLAVAAAGVVGRASALVSSWLPVSPIRISSAIGQTVDRHFGRSSALFFARMPTVSRAFGRIVTIRCA